MPVQQQGIFREFITYIIWLALAVIISMFFLFLIAFVVFQTDRVPPEVAFLPYVAAWAVTYLRLKKKGKTFTDIGLRRTGPTRPFLGGMLAGAVFMVTVHTILVLTGTIESKPEGLTASVALAALAGFAYTLIQSSAEEVVFRGYLLHLFARKGRVFSIVLTSTLFSFAHFGEGVNLVGWLNIFLFGVFIAQLFYVFNSLWAPVGFHVAWNFMQKYIFSFPVYGKAHSGVFHFSLIDDSLITGGAYGPEGSVLTTVLLFASLLRLRPVRRPAPQDTGVSN